MSIKNISKSKMTWYRFLGLLQTDGYFYVSVDTDSTLRPRIGVTISEKREDLISLVIDFLKSNDLFPQRSKADQKSDRGINIYVERIRNCKKVIQIITSLEVSLVGQKKLDFEIVKKIIEI